MPRVAFLTVAALLLAICSARADGDPEIGKRQFLQCTICHSVDAAAPAKIGPTLHGLFGRKAGTVPGFAYSAPMKNSGIVWDADTIDKWITKPMAMVPGTKMIFPGVADPAMRANIIAYLKDATK